jgi:hypothetical protein
MARRKMQPLGHRRHEFRRRGWNHGSCAVTVSMVSGFGIAATPSPSFRDNREMTHSRKMPQIIGENAGSIRLNIFSLSLASELHQQKA